MSAVIIEGQFDIFRPRKLAPNKETELVITSDVNMLLKIETWARTQRQLTEHVAKPLFPEVRLKVLEITGVIGDHPRMR